MDPREQDARERERLANQPSTGDAPGKKVTLADMKLTGKPTQITFAFFVPAGFQVKEVRMGETLVKSVDLAVQ